MKTKFQRNIKLSTYTSIGLGGNAGYFLKCEEVDDITIGLKFAGTEKLETAVLSGGSNIIFDDQGFKGLVLKIELKGIDFSEDSKYLYAIVKAGENWDELVKVIIAKGYSGIECLSGIPGSVGATPVQNVGAYGQEIKDVIVSVNTVDRTTLDEVIFSNDDCLFGYRSSRFKNENKDRYIITEVTFRFEKDKQPEIKYNELQSKLELEQNYSITNNLIDKLIIIRNCVIELRKAKSMVIDPFDQNSRSCGSFFMNPVLNEIEFKIFADKNKNIISEIPVYKNKNEYKISAAWLVENAGFVKGYKKGSAGISANHSLAIVNLKIDGSAFDILSLASDIEKKVLVKFGISLNKEPVIIKY